MSVEVNNESGAVVDEAALAQLGRFVLDAYRGEYWVNAWGRLGALRLSADRPSESVVLDAPA